MFKRIIAGLIALLFMIIAGIALWYFNRPLPDQIENEAIFEGILYSRIVDKHIPLVYHIIEIDLNQPDIHFFTTPPDDIQGFDYAARTTSGFLEEFDLQVAINGDFFDPWFSYTPFYYYPKIGDGVNARGLTVSDRQLASTGYAPQASATFYFTEDNQVSFEEPDIPIQTAISGNVLVVENGIYSITENNPYLDNRHPRTAIAVDESGERLLLFVIDGRQPNYSHGVTMPGLANIIIQHGGYTALNLDGGGSVAMVIAGEYGNPQLLNSAIHSRIPFRERPIANHFGVYTAISDRLMLLLKTDN